MKKIVLSRSLDVKSSEKIDKQKLLRELAEHNKHGYTFAVNLPKGEKENSKTLIEQALNYLFHVMVCKLFLTR